MSKKFIPFIGNVWAKPCNVVQPEMIGERLFHDYEGSNGSNGAVGYSVHAHVSNPQLAWIIIDTYVLEQVWYRGDEQEVCPAYINYEYMLANRESVDRAILPAECWDGDASH
jgi:hypothetical protein